jgi:acetolactate synthase I/II/III large subunit
MNDQRHAGGHLFRFLSERGTNHVFLVPGAQVDGLVEYLVERGRPIPIVAAHEAGAGYMADGYFRASGKMGAAMAIGGPGAANLASAAAVAKSDASAVLFITGNIPTAHQGRGEFQDGWPAGSNDAEMFRALIGISEIVASNSDWQRAINAVGLALSGNCPAHLMVPLDMQYDASTDDMVEMTASPVQDPVLSMGTGGWLDGRTTLILGQHVLDMVSPSRLLAFSTQCMIPVITDSIARGLLPEDAPTALGHIGFMPHPRALAALAPNTELASQRVVHAGVKRHLLDRFVDDKLPRLEVPVEALANLLDAPPPMTDGTALYNRSAWITKLQGIDRPAPAPQAGETVPLATLMQTLATHLPGETLYCVDAGQVRRQAIRHLCAKSPRTLLAAENLAPMGWGIGAAIGAQLARPDRPVVALAGDGSLYMHGMELATAARHSLPILFVICDNGGYGSIAARKPTLANLVHLRGPDIVALAEALGIQASRTHDPEEIARVASNHGKGRHPRVLVVDVPWVDEDAFTESSTIRWLA